MVKLIDDSALDAAAAVIDNATAIILCSDAPEDYEGVAALTLATAVVDSSDFVAAADGNDYRITVSAQEGVTVTSAGTGTHLVGTDGSSTILFATTTAPMIVSTTTPVNFPGFDIVFASTDPTAGDMTAAVYDPGNVLSDAFARANHTGVQDISTITGLQSALDDKADDGATTSAISSAMSTAISTANNYTDDAISNIEPGDSLPDQSGHNGHVLTTNGSEASWESPAGGGDMFVATYDPNGVEADVYDYENFTNTPTLGTAAAEDVEAFATAAQGTAADTAVQPGDTGTMTWFVYDDESDARPTGVDLVVWTPSDNELDDPTNADEFDIVWRSGEEVSGGGNVLVYDGDEYVQAEAATYVGPVEPADPTDGDVWIDPVEAVQYVWWDVEWIVLAGEGPEPTAPGQVTGLVATPGMGQVSLEWDNPASGGDPITDYQIERADDDNGVPDSWTTLTDGTSTDTTYTDTDVTGGETYWYRVSAVNGVGTGTASTAVSATPTAAPSLFVAEGAAAVLSTTAPQVTFAAPPEEDDIVVIFATSDSSASLYSEFDDTNWILLAGGEVSDGAVSMALVGIAHVVTSAEALADTVQFGTRVWQTGEVGEAVGAVVRGVSASSPIDDDNSWSTGSVTTTQTLAGLTGANLSNGSLVLSFFATDGIREVSGVSAGWTEVVATTETNQTGVLYSLDETTTASVDVPAGTVTLAVGDEGASITVALSAA